jgi:hypothetical protein
VAAVTSVGVWLAIRPLPPEVPAPATPTAQPPPRVRQTGSEWLRRYAQVDAGDEHARHRLVLEQVAEHNMPDSWDDWATVTVKGRKGSVVEFEVSPHGLRIGTDEDWVEIPLDGPHSAAAAEILGLHLATAWMVDQIYEAARSKGRVVHYYAATQIAKSLGYSDWNPNDPDGVKMRSIEFFKQRSELLRDQLRQQKVDDSALASGYFKSVVPPIDGVTRSGGLEMIGGYNTAGERIQPLSGGFHERTFFDYSQNLRLAKGVLRVDGRPMTMGEFFGSVKYALEFGFRRSSVPTPAYPYPEDLAEWMQTRDNTERQR